jgi:hypothetical protein
MLSLPTSPHIAQSQLLRAPIMGLFRFKDVFSDRKVSRYDSALKINFCVRPPGRKNYHSRPSRYAVSCNMRASKHLSVPMVSL